MQARTTFPHRLNLALWVAALLGLGLLTLLPLSLLKPWRFAAPPAAAPPSPRVAYFQFGAAADTLWLADANDPSRRQKLFVVPHAAEFGVVPSLAPDGRRFVYTALPPRTREPTPDTPADLWLASLERGSQPRLLARGLDLLVRPVWSPDGDFVVARRSDAGGFRLVGINVASGAARVLVASPAALFPVGFAPRSNRLYYVQIDERGSSLLAADLASDEPRPVALLSEGLTRDWALSPAGDRLAFLTMTLAGDRVATRAMLLDLASGAIAPAGDAAADEFSPVWQADGALALGRLGEGHGGLVLNGAGLRGPARGFDVPLAAAPAGGGFIVRSFEGASATAPGRSVLAFVRRDGTRQTIAYGEVTLVGWAAGP